MSGTATCVHVPLQRAPLEPAPRSPRPAWAGPLAREAALVTVLFVLYNAGRVLAAQRVSGAFDNAERLWQVQRWLRLPSEVTLQALVLDAPGIVRAANGYYASVHFPLTFLVLLWLFLRRPDAYPWARRALVLASGAALLVQVLVPMAPPRMLTGLGFVDTGLAYGQSVYGAVGDDALSNQFAAMPSLHVGWALLVAVVLVRTGRSRARWLWTLHPALTLVVVVVTANHYWLDGLVGAVLVLAALRVTAAPCTRTVALAVDRRGMPAHGSASGPVVGAWSPAVPSVSTGAGPLPRR